MWITKPQPAFADARGRITDLLVHEPVDSIAVITSAKGTTRGNHYHKQTVQWVYLQSGRIKALTRKGDGPVEVRVLEPGDLQMSEPHDAHALVALEDSEFFVFTRGPRGGEDYESDTYRLGEPLRDPDET